MFLFSLFSVDKLFITLALLQKINGKYVTIVWNMSTIHCNIFMFYIPYSKVRTNKWKYSLIYLSEPDGTKLFMLDLVRFEPNLSKMCWA